MSDRRPSRRARRWMPVALSNVAIFAVLLEIAALFASWADGDRFRYVDRREPQEQGEEPGTNPSLLHRLHPYFGYIIQPGKTRDLGGAQVRANNFGFNSPFDYPVTRTRGNEFIVAVLGGSVAAHYSRYERGRTDGGGLRALPSLSGREVVILNFGSGGYKQPQQLAVLTYFLAIGQPVDLVINIDGFNDVALARLNQRVGVAASMPSVDHISRMVDLTSGRWDADSVQALARMAALRGRLADFEGARAGCRFAACDQWFRLRIRLAGAELVRAAATIDSGDAAEDTLFELKRTAGPVGGFEELAELWASSSTVIHDLTRGRGIPYIHVLQPNQYAPNARVFGEAERRIALNENGPYSAAAREGYPHLLAEIGRLREHGVDVSAPLDLFDDLPHQAYRDDCCHYTIEGNRALSDYVAIRAGSALSLSSSVADGARHR